MSKAHEVAEAQEIARRTEMDDTLWATRLVNSYCNGDVTTDQMIVRIARRLTMIRKSGGKRPAAK